jgi:hypothetical protein
MFASRIARPQTKIVESSASRPTLQRSSSAARPVGSLKALSTPTRANAPALSTTARKIAARAEVAHDSSEGRESVGEKPPVARAPCGASWNFCDTPVSSPKRADRRQPLSASPKRIAMQPKLEIGSADDPLEHEADRVADQVMRMPDAGGGAITSSSVQVSRKCDACERNDDDKVRMKPAAPSFATRPTEAPHSVHDVLASSGQRLDEHTRAFFEPRFGIDFVNVRVHTDGEAAASAASIGAQAYTAGRDIVFATGKYEPTSSAGRRLLAHELAHVVQQHASDGVSPEAGRPATEPTTDRIQRFESEEHQHLGDVATGAATYDLGGKNDKFELTHGDIVALSGDVFAPDDLFRLAAIPGDRGAKVGTRDEILWGLQDPRIWEMRAAKSGPYAGKSDPRFQAGGPYAGYVYSDAVKSAVFERYQKLGAANAGHFAAPKGRDAGGAPAPAADSAGGNYRTLHEVAIRQADQAGRAKADIGMAMAREAAAQHFLTDSFSAGHLRTPISLIRDYWGAKYPLFWYNLRHKIALDTAIEMTSGTLVTAHYGYTQILTQVEAMAPTLPAVTLGDLLGSVFHDVDNEQGVGIEGVGKVMGDAHLDAHTEKLAVAAIQAGNKDILKAYTLGQQRPSPPPDAKLFSEVRMQTGGSGSKYAPELMAPTPAKSEPPQNWKAADIMALWDQPLLGKAGPTVGQTISARVQGGSISVQLRALADKFPISQTGLHPRAAYLKGFVDKLVANPKAGILDIINWAPHDMLTGDAAQETAADLAAKGAAGNKTENLSNMTPAQQDGFLAQLIDGGGAADQASIIAIFAAAPAGDRPAIYQRIEGHPWLKDFNRTLGSRDKLYKAMSGKNIDRLKDVINGI